MFPRLDAKETGDNGPLEVGRKDPLDAERAEERIGIADRDPFEDNDRDDSALVKHPSQTASTVYVRTPFYSFPRKEREKTFLFAPLDRGYCRHPSHPNSQSSAEERGGKEASKKSSEGKKVELLRA